jgi:exosortase F-associated protein
MRWLLQVHKGETINDFYSCKCGGKLKYIKIFNDEPNKENKHRDIKLFKSFSSSAFNFIILSIISISLLILPSSAALIMNFSPLIAVVLFVVLAFRFILNENNTNNSVIKFFVEKYIFLVIPLIIIFTGTLVNKALLILLK